MKTVQNIILFFSILLFIGLVYISAYNVYQTDDFIFAFTTEKFGFLQNAINFYTNWGGRFFSYNLNMIVPLKEDRQNILPKIYPIFLFVSFIATLACNFKLFFKYNLGESLRKSFLFFFFYTVSLLSISEHYFWFSGANIYFLPVILSLLLFYFLGKYQHNARKLYFWFSLFLVIILMGSNEIIGLLLLGSLSIYYFSKKSTENLILLMIGLLFFSIMIFAPGNFKRLDDQEGEFFLKSLKRIAVFGANTFYIFIKALFIIPLFMTVFEREFRFVINKINVRKSLLIWILSFVPILFLSYILNTIGRQFETIVIYFLLSSSLLLFFYFENIKKFWWLSLIFLFFPTTNIFPKKYENFNIHFNLNSVAKEILQTDLSGYTHEIENRVNLLENSKSDSLIVPKISTLPKILYFREMAAENEEEIYINDQLQKYFNKKYIRVRQ